VALAILLTALIVPVCFAVSFDLDRMPMLNNSEFVVGTLLLADFPDTLRLFVVGTIFVSVASAVRRSSRASV
jgi:hypothetical protein